MRPHLLQHPEIGCEVPAVYIRCVTTHESPLLDFFVLFPHSRHPLCEFLVRQFVLKFENG